LRFADETARFSLTPAKLGLTYSLASTKRIVHLLGPAMAKDLLFSARVVTGAEAYRIGLISHMVDGDVESAVLGYADGLCALSTYSHRTNKRNVELALSAGAAQSKEAQDAFLEAFSGEDFIEGVAAFQAKRRPRFRGR
jgi:enoyl-CoA hydratase/carnithine racemase